jgi:2-polyprenyl-3-methyl-5-hydroxy-6-metoxy-1,4-benzoquinol methylase
MESKQGVSHCRLCYSALYSKPILSLQPFPKAAQFYPEPEEFSQDKGIILDVYQCLACELVQLKILPVDYYREVITAASLSPNAKQARLAEMKTFSKDYQLANKTALEVGCGKGGMLDVIAEAGFQSIGIEYSPSSTEKARSQGRNVVCTYLDDYQPSEKVEVFFSFNYLEHQPDVKKFIAAIDNITTDDAIGYITVPNLDYLLKSKCLYEFVADHLVYFTQKTFTRAFESNGFDVLRSELINNGNDILAIVKKRQQIDLTPDINEIVTLAKELNILVNSQIAEGKKVSVWGAGHRSLALMSISQLNQIEFIVDSADFKQGKYSPVMFNKIVSPQTFEQSDVDVVIVMVPGIYPQEVLATLRTYERKIEAYTLEGNRLVKAQL